MLPYSRSFLYENDFGVLKAEEYMDFWQKVPEKLSFSIDDGIKLFDTNDLEKSLFDEKPYRAPEQPISSKTIIKQPETQKTKAKTAKRHGKKVKNCHSKGNKLKLKRKRLKLQNKGIKKYMIPISLGLLVAKGVLLPLFLKGVALISVKGFLMGFFSTILATFLTLKGLFDQSNRYQGRRDDKTQLEIVHLPENTQHHYDEHYLKRTDHGFPPSENAAYEVYSLPQKQFLHFPLTLPVKTKKNRFHIKNPAGVKKWRNKYQNVTLLKSENEKKLVSNLI